MAVELAVIATGFPGQAPIGRTPGGPAPSGRADVQATVPSPAPARPAPVNASASFAVDEGTGLITIKLINAQTGELIRRIPTREYIQLVLDAGEPKGTLFEARS